MINPGLSFRDVEAILTQIGDAAERVVVVGGQAVNFWATLYEHRVEELRAAAPFTSKDMDFCGGSRELALMAQRLRGTPRLAGFDDNPPQVGTITFHDATGVERVIDVMTGLTGLSSDEVTKESIQIIHTTEAGVQLSLRIMHPVHVLRSRAYNVLASEKYRTPHGLGQLRAAFLCAREFLKDLSSKDAKRTLTWNERLFEFRISKPGREVAIAYQVDALDAVYVGPGLPQAFYDRRYPQMRMSIEGLKGTP